MRKPVGVGIIGAGFIGRVHAKAARVAGGQLIGVVDRSLASSEALVRDLGIGRVFEEADDLIANPDVMVVHICVPNHLHAQLVADTVAAGKHVICEKPLAMSTSEAKKLEALAAAAGVVAATPFVYRYYPMVGAKDPGTGAERRRRQVEHGARLVPTGLVGERSRRQLACGSLPGWGVAGIRGYRRALGRPRRITSDQRITRLCATAHRLPTRNGQKRAVRSQDRRRCPQ